MKVRVRLVDGGLPSVCWEMLGARGRLWPYSYPTIKLGEVRVSARRYAYAQTHGPIPEGMQVHSRCALTLCVNPDHLFLRRYGDPVYRDALPLRLVAA